MRLVGPPINGGSFLDVSTMIKEAGRERGEMAVCVCVCSFLRGFRFVGCFVWRAIITWW